VARLRRSVDRPEVGAQQIAHAHAVAAHLVRVGGTDALARSADLGAALRRFVGGVEDAVRGQDQVGLLRNAELPREVVAALGELLRLGAEQDGVEHHAVADDVGLAALKNTRRDRTEHVLLAVELEGMTGIGTALKTGYDFITGSQHVHYLPLALVAPLQAEDHIYFLHAIRKKVWDLAARTAGPHRPPHARPRIATDRAVRPKAAHATNRPNGSAHEKRQAIAEILSLLIRAKRILHSKVRIFLRKAQSQRGSFQQK
jgi:hypothetical protein